MCIEAYAGTTRLSRVMKDCGFRTLAIDKTLSRTEDTHIATYELSCDDQVDSLLTLMEKDIDNLIYIHFVPACGTPSRALERPLEDLE